MPLDTQPLVAVKASPYPSVHWVRSRNPFVSTGSVKALCGLWADRWDDAFGAEVDCVRCLETHDRELAEGL
jgi:hypothetical protein